MNSTTLIRVRFAPSPTGYLHVGGLRTALYNYLFARKYNGTFILRIEDTDRARYVEAAVENLIQTLTWSGIGFDEGPEKGGKFSPYIQSQRLGIYQKHADILLERKKAYRCFCTPERLEEMRKKQEKMKVSPKYDRRCLRLTEEEVQRNLSDGVPFVVRVKIPESTTVAFEDVIREKVEFDSDQIDDQVLMKSDGYPTYHLANVVDDHLMEITHVIRGEEWLSSTPKHVLLYEYFGWKPPIFAHLPLLLNSDRSKLSKRQGDVAVEEYRAKGYLPEALVNFVALLGWNPGTEQEVFSFGELIDQFSLEKVNKAGAVFNIEKLDWLNFEHFRRKPEEEVLQMLKDELRKSRFQQKHFADKYLLMIISAMRERVSFAKDFIEKCPFFFEGPVGYDKEVVRKRWKGETSNHLKKLVEVFKRLENPGKEDYEAALNKTAESLSIGNGQLIHAVRLALSGVGVGPGLYDMLFILGKEESINRINAAIEKIKPV